MPDDQVEKASSPRGRVERDAVAAFDQEKRPPAALQGFGLWNERNVDGLEYQDRARAEWDR